MRDVAVYILRHGETDYNLQGIIQGQLDVPLNDMGRKQAEQVGEYLKVIPFTHAFTSDLKRASDTAHIVMQHHPNVTLQETELLRERHLGLMQGMSGKEAHSRRKDLDKSAERRDVLIRRLLDWWISCIKPLYMSGSPDDPPALVLAVSHGATIGTLIHALHGELGFSSEVPIKPRQPLYNTCISLIEARVNDEKTRVDPCIVLFGDIRHMAGPNEVINQKENVDVIPNNSPETKLTAK